MSALSTLHGERLFSAMSPHCSPMHGWGQHPCDPHTVASCIPKWIYDMFSPELRALEYMNVSDIMSDIQWWTLGAWTRRVMPLLSHVCRILAIARPGLCTVSWPLT